ncbi:pentatricopeptide repeat-containing protein At5g15300-like [Bidens hawaiensis]|uniref:pentatricopeptide repeat-containing protein At5g15300-like n=1 Tax=Bidens hawaiensis TaxID=980011 RepID=UPI00404B9C97
MSVSNILKLSKPLEKFREIHKNLKLKPSPNLWSDNHSPTVKPNPTLHLTHPILTKLESHPTINLTQFNQIHTQLIVLGLFQHPLAAGRVLKKLCSCKSTLHYAAGKLFYVLNEPDTFMFNIVIRGLLNVNELVMGLGFYRLMIRKEVKPNYYTYPLVVRICSELGVVIEGEKVFTRVVKDGFEFDLYVRNALIRFYSVCGLVRDAERVFYSGVETDMVTWNLMIDGYVKNGMVEDARRVFDEMPERDVVSWNVMIAGYGLVGQMGVAKGLFDEMPWRDVVSWNTLIDGYARVNDVACTRRFFDRMPGRNVVSWNTLLGVYVRCGKFDECLVLFDKMLEEGVKANEASVMSVLIACGHLGRLDKGEWVHDYIRNNENVVTDVLLSTALLTMYAKCGAMDVARRVFDEMPERTIVSWNSMIMGYGMHGHGEKALEMFLELEKSDLVPNDATFVCVLSACTHAGMVLEGWWYFDLMQRVYMIEPKAEHYGCMVDLLSRAGLMKDSEEIIKYTPLKTGPALWGALLSACRTHSSLELGEMVAKRLMELEPNNVGPYVLLSNIYASAERWDDAENVREMMMKNGLQKPVGSSLVRAENHGVESVRGHSLHKKRLMYSMLSDMGVQMKMSHKNIVK